MCVVAFAASRLKVQGWLWEVTDVLDVKRFKKMNSWIYRRMDGNRKTGGDGGRQTDQNRERWNNFSKRGQMFGDID